MEREKEKEAMAARESEQDGLVNAARAEEGGFAKA